VHCEVYLSDGSFKNVLACRYCMVLSSQGFDPYLKMFSNTGYDEVWMELD